MSGLEKALFNLKVCFFRERGGRDERGKRERDTDLMELRNSLQQNNSIDKLRKPGKMRRQRRINSKRSALPFPLPPPQKPKKQKTKRLTNNNPGNPTRPHRHRPNLRAELHPQIQRASQSAASRKPHRRRREPRSNRRNNAPSNRQHGERRTRHGPSHESHGPGENLGRHGSFRDPV